MDAMQELLEKQLIRETLIAYARALDTHKPERILNEAFTKDARVDYSASGGIVGTPEELLEWLNHAMARFDNWQHLLSNFVIEVNGSEAKSRTECFNPLQGSDEQGELFTVLVGCCYKDRLVKGDQGWRISDRVLSVSWMHEL